jgi:hypothetical protein
MNRPTWGALLLIVAVAVAGCSKSDSAATADKSAAGANPAGADPTVETGSGTVLTRNVEKRPSLEGRWVLLFYQRLSGMEVPAALLDISKSSKDGKLMIKKPVQFGTALSGPTLKQAQVTPDTVHLVLEMAVQSMGPNGTPHQQMRQADVVIEFHDGLARGSAQFDPLDTFLVAMVPTQIDTVQELRPQMLPESAEMEAAKKDRDDFLQKAATFVNAHPNNPMTIELYPVLFSTAQERKLDKSAVEAMADQYVKSAKLWGERMAFKARIDVISSLIKTSYLPQTTLKQIDLALSQLTEDKIQLWKPVLEQMKEQARANEALTQAHAGTPEERAKAIPFLRERDRKIPYDPIVLVELARYDDEHGKPEDALKEYARLAVLPLFDEILQQVWKGEAGKRPTSRESVEKVWKGLHKGSTDGLDKYLDDVYAQSMPKFTEKPVQPRPADPDNRVVLCELFTGASCGPCVAADVAYSHLIKTYAPTEMIALQYHEHIPQPDPLTNQDSEARFKFYFPDRGGTPTFVVDGVPAQRGGLLHQANEVYAGIRQMIDHFLAQKTSVRIQLAAQPKGSTVEVKADAEGAFPPNEPIHLRLALVEERILMHAHNGIREHEMVVRFMPGGPLGVEIKDGKLHYDGKVNLQSIKQELKDQLIADEEKSKSKFDAKPLDLAHLRLVAFVQNDQTHEIYQAKMVPFPAADSKAAAAQPAAAQPATVAGKKP